MASWAIGILDVLAPHAKPVATAALEEISGDGRRAELRAQRMRLVALYSLALAIASTLWVAAHCALLIVAANRPWLRFAITVVQAAILCAAGWSALYACRRRHLRIATYCNVAALTLAATINLATVTNAEGAAVVTYAVAVGLAALAIEGREWMWWSAVFGVAALIGSLLHVFQLSPQIALPPAVAAAALVFAATLGLAVPMGLFWLFSRDVSTSHARAWRLAREAARAHELASERAAQLERRSEQLQAKNAELNDFLYVVSHDLRAPLINLEGFSRALQDGVAALDGMVGPAPPDVWATLKGDIDESLDFIVRSVGKMDFFVQGLLELSRIDSRPDLAQSVDLAQLVRAILDSLGFTIGARGIDVRVDPLPTIIGDPVRVNQVFGNLIDNAVKYMRPAGPAVIHVGCARRDGALQFFVRDNGVGIRPEDQGKIFRLFGRVGGYAVPGDGMGLTTVKRIVEKQSGKIWVESALGRGSTFWFTLPGCEAAKTSAEEDAYGSAARSGEDSAGRR